MLIKQLLFNFLLLAAGGAAALVSMVASLTPLPSALAADLVGSSVEATNLSGLTPLSADNESDFLTNFFSVKGENVDLLVFGVVDYNQLLGVLLDPSWLLNQSWDTGQLSYSTTMTGEKDEAPWVATITTSINIGINTVRPKPVAEPSLTLGFVTLGSLMLGSRKKKEAKKT